MVSQTAVNLVKKWEGKRLTAYKDQAGIWTIGYGTTAAAGVGVKPKRGMTITEAEAEWYLQKALEKFSQKLDEMLHRQANSNQYAALLSLAYNIGPGAFRKSSALRHFNNGDLERVPASIRLWNKITDPRTGKKRVSNGLVNRRNEEAALFATPVPAAEPEAPAPATWWQSLLTAILRLFRP
ncbi:lysozyme [Halovulum sp. GXIMD14793]